MMMRKKKIVKYILTLGTLLFLLIVSFSCKSPTAFITHRLSLSVSDVSCTETWIKLTINNAPLPTNIVIKRNGNNLFSFNLTSNDTTLYDSTLSPNQSYSYQAEYGKGFPTERSETVTAKTMDTTSSNFTWQTFTFGGNAGSCNLNDVAIINDTLAYAVGEVYLNDSTGQVDQQPYSIAKWNGKEWELKKLFYNSGLIIPSVRGILVVELNDIWLAAGSVFHWDGISPQAQLSFSRLNISNPNATVEKLWATSSSSLYGVGNAGTIVHYNVTTWQKLESGTTNNINDIWGITDNSGNNIVLCPAYNLSSGGDKELLKIENGSVSNIPWLNKELYTVWFSTTNKIYAGGEGLYNNAGGSWKEEDGLPSLFVFRVRGNGLNDIYACGGYGLCAHYNGLRWTTYNEVSLPNGNYWGMAVKGDMVVLVGSSNGSAVITVGKRN